jgi:hypothetical protein
MPPVAVPPLPPWLPPASPPRPPLAVLLDAVLLFAPPPVPAALLAEEPPFPAPLPPEEEAEALVPAAAEVPPLATERPPEPEDPPLPELEEFVLVQAAEPMHNARSTIHLFIAINVAPDSKPSTLLASTHARLGQLAKSHKQTEFYQPLLPPWQLFIG